MCVDTTCEKNARQKVERSVVPKMRRPHFGPTG